METLKKITLVLVSNLGVLPAKYYSEILEYIHDVIDDCMSEVEYNNFFKDCFWAFKYNEKRKIELNLAINLNKKKYCFSILKMQIGDNNKRDIDYGDYLLSFYLFKDEEYENSLGSESLLSLYCYKPFSIEGINIDSGEFDFDKNIVLNIEKTISNFEYNEVFNKRYSSYDEQITVFFDAYPKSSIGYNKFERLVDSIPNTTVYGKTIKKWKRKRYSLDILVRASKKIDKNETITLFVHTSYTEENEQNKN